LEINPTNANDLLNKGFSLAELAKYKEAIDCYDKALAIDPNYALAWGNKALSLDKLGRHDEAKECYDKAQQQTAQKNDKSIKEELNFIR
jgi:tetratricopeptide (TPR) repeat protein